jgi:isopenicillin-N epimerase
MFSALLPELDIDQLKLDLYNKYKIEVPILRWNDQPLIRVSIQAYNDQEDTNKLLSALTQLLPK